MDKSSLIDFNNDNCYKVSSPLIPTLRSAAPRLSDVGNNPFDKVLRTIANLDDPFECDSNISEVYDYKNNLNNEGKENIGHLISPIQTPVKSKKHKDDSIFLEATQLAEVFRTSAVLLKDPIDLDEDITQCSPPWSEEEIEFADDDENLNEKDKNESTPNSSITYINNPREVPVLHIESSDGAVNCEDQGKITVKQNTETSSETKAADNTKVKNTTDLLNNLTAILNSNVTDIDQRKLGENLLNSLTLALNIDNQTAHSSSENKKPVSKLQRSKSDSKVSEKNRHSLENLGNKLTVPKIKIQPAAPVKIEKKLKVGNEKEKAKGPLKAFIPLTNMAKSKRSIGPKINLANATPPKQLLHSSQNKKMSTPNELKLKSPIAQSTPDESKKSGTDINSETSVKRQFGFSISPLARPASTSDISNTLNNSLSPKNTSSSAPNLNKSGSNTSRHTPNTSIPTIKSLHRRNSVSDMTSRSSVLNRSYENNQPVRPPVQLKRSSSFQNKTTSAPVIQAIKKLDNNNTMKKYGAPGILKSLQLVPKSKKPVK